jgi:HSP20 family molecular chaperone IbpA
MAFNNWFEDDDDEDFYEQLREMQRRVSRIMRNQLKEIIEALKEEDMGGEMHIRPIDGPGVKGYIMWGQLSNSPDVPETRKKARSLISERSRTEKVEEPEFSLGRRQEEDEEEQEDLELAIEPAKPLIEKFKSKDEYVILVVIPGVDESDLKVNIKGGMLWISGGEKFTPSRIRLPIDARPARLKKSYKNGVLEIKIPRVTDRR